MGIYVWGTSCGAGTKAPAAAAAPAGTAAAVETAAPETQPAPEKVALAVPEGNPAGIGSYDDLAAFRWGAYRLGNGQGGMAATPGA